MPLQIVHDGDRTVVREFIADHPTVRSEALSRDAIAVNQMEAIRATEVEPAWPVQVAANLE